MNVSLQERSIVLTTHVAQMECAITLVEFVFVTKDTKDTIVKVNIPFLSLDCSECIQIFSLTFR